MRQSRRNWICYRAVVLALATLARAQRVITSQYDNARTGANLNETSLTPRNVNVSTLERSSPCTWTEMSTPNRSSWAAW